jgi:hypothetical protein
MAGTETKQTFTGTITAVKARIRLLRSFDQISHAYLGYVLVLDGELDGQPVEELRIAVGPKAHETHQFRIGDRVSGMAVAVADAETEWGTHYKVSGLRILARGPAEQAAAANPDGGIAPPLPEYRARGHRRLDAGTHAAKCGCCPFGLAMPTEITIDQWDPPTSCGVSRPTATAPGTALDTWLGSPTGCRGGSRTWCGWTTTWRGRRNGDLPFAGRRVP